MNKPKYQFIISAFLISLSSITAAIDYPDYDEPIKGFVAKCKHAQKLHKETTSKASIESGNSYIDCFKNSMILEMNKAPQYRELILESALRANSDHIPEIIEASIGAGMAPLVTLMRAIEIYPEYGEEIRRGAISAGVDPFVVTEATSDLEN